MWEKTRQFPHGVRACPLKKESSGAHGTRLIPRIHGISENMNLRSLLLPLSIICFSSCSSVSHTLIAPEVESPLIASDKVIDFVVRSAPGREVTLFNDASNRPPVYSTNFMAGQSRAGAILGGLSYSLKGLSFSGGLLGANSLIEGMWVGGKLQLFGRQGLFSDSPLYLTGWARLGGHQASKRLSIPGAVAFSSVRTLRVSQSACRTRALKSVGTA